MSPRRHPVATFPAKLTATQSEAIDAAAAAATRWALTATIREVYPTTDVTVVESDALAFAAVTRDRLREVE